MSRATDDKKLTAIKIGMLVCLREALEPELWRVVDIEGRIANLKPISLGATPRQVPLPDLRRYRIKTTDQVFRNEEAVRVVRSVNPRANDVYIYRVADDSGEYDARETELTVQVGSAAHDPVAQCANLDAAPAPVALARSALLHDYFDATARSLGIVGYNGARMLPIPHQINAGRFALLFGRPRFLLADEVGLGKTVEAGLIVSTLRKYFPEWRTAFFVPESLTVQWAFEMYGKFGKSIFRVDEELELDEDDDDPGVILAHGRAPSWARKNRADILVVDEAHQVIRHEALYEALLELSREATAVLLLTATPSSDDGANLERLLHLCDPDAMDRVGRGRHRLDALLRQRAGVEDFLRALRDHQLDGEQLRARWDGLELGDDDIAARLMAMPSGHDGVLARHKLAALVTDFYHPGVRILRYQRKFLAMDNEMAGRIEDSIVYKPTKEEETVAGVVVEWLAMVQHAGHSDVIEWQNAARTLLQAAHSSPLAVRHWIDARRGELAEREGVSADPIRRLREELEALEWLDGEEEIVERLDEATEKWQRATRSLDMKGRALARSGRYEALRKQLVMQLAQEEDQRLIVFTSFEVNVKPLALLLGKALGEDIEVVSLSAEVPWREREKAAFAFQESRGSCVLVSDDLGGEGRNFQFATALFHFDVPLAAWVLEQRIGRLDRVGRESEMDVDSVVFVAEGGLGEDVHRFLRDAVGVFNESVAPVEDRLEEVTDSLMRAVFAGGGEAVDALIDEVQGDLEERRRREVAALVSRTDTGVEEVKRLVPRLDDREELNRLSKSVVGYTRLLGSVVDDSDERLTITVGSHHPLHGTPGVLGEMQGYFDRRLAVRHERLEFFSPGHPFVRAMARGALIENDDRVAMIARPGLPHAAMVFSFRVFLPSKFLESARELDAGSQAAVLCSAAENFPTTMLRVGVRFGDANKSPEVFDLAASGDTFACALREHDLSLDEGPGVESYLPRGGVDAWPALCRQAAEIAAAHAQPIAARLLTERTPAFEAVATEVFTREQGRDHGVETRVEALLYELDPLGLEIDSLVVFLPA